MGTIKRRHVKAVIQLRRATEAEWIERDPILRLGEPAVSIDINRMKIGVGDKHWSELDYLGGEDMLAGNGIVIANRTISLDDLILDCGTSTTNV